MLSTNSNPSEPWTVSNLQNESGECYKATLSEILREVFQQEWKVSLPPNQRISGRSPFHLLGSYICDIIWSMSQNILLLVQSNITKTAVND